MARINTANPLVYGTPQRGSTGNKRASTLDANTTSSSIKNGLPKTTSHSQKQMARLSTLFDILPDAEHTTPESEHGRSTGKQSRPRTLGIARVNSLLLPKNQRRRPAARETVDYDKENDVPEHATDGYRTPDSTPTRQTPTRQDASQASGRPRNEHMATRESMPDDQAEVADNQDLDDSFDSLDSFIVSDNEEISIHEGSDHETPDTEEEPTPPPSPVRSPRKRLMRGRKPTPDMEPSTKPEDREVESKDTMYKSKTDTSEDDAPRSEPKSHRKFPHETVPPEPQHSKYPVHNSDDLIKYLKNLDIHSEEEDTPQSPISKSFSDSEDEPPARLKPGHKDSAPLTPLTARTKDTVPTTIRAQKKAEAARKRDLRAQVAEFNENKIGFAEEFLRHLDSIFDNQISKMTKDTGGIKLIWTKNFRNTAGRATVRSERVFMREGDIEDPGRRRYNATIELSEKVLDTEDKILCTLTHEYCHLLDILITENRGKGAAQHGASFKQWGSRCTQALRDHPIYGGRVEVTTKHTYEINHKYVWACVGLGCPFEVGRHSKSVDPIRHRCGRCRGYLKQIKPVPRAAPKKSNVKVVIDLED